jgi:DNA-binding CsgD family transcriptional regulator
MGHSPERFQVHMVLQRSLADHPAKDAEKVAPGGERVGLPSPLSNDIEAPTARWWSGALFAAIALVIALDLVADWRAGSDPGHLGLEAVVLVLAAAGAWRLWAQFRLERKQVRGLHHRLAAASAAAEMWRRGTEELLAGLGREIDRQFAAWGLTLAEREIALLMLKGLSLREIAGVRETSERTVRQQTLAVYRKAGVAGRAELAAFFLEDLLLPRDPPGG